MSELAFPILHRYAEPQVVTVPDSEMREGQRLVAERLKQVVEMSAGASMAAAMKV